MDPREMRVGHAERDETAEVLRVAAGDGRLTLEELDERLERALGARTAGELAELTADLGPTTLAIGGSAGRPALAPGTAGGSGDDRLVISTGWGDTERRGTWDVPPFLYVRGGVGDIRLDCRQARALTPVIDVRVRMSAGDVTFIVPSDWAAQADVRGGIGDVRLLVAATPGRDGALLRLWGKGGLGDLRVRHPSPFDPSLR